MTWSVNLKRQTIVHPDGTSIRISIYGYVKNMNHPKEALHDFCKIRDAVAAFRKTIENDMIGKRGSTERDTYLINIAAVLNDYGL